jgi:hypothetical protein
MFKEARKKYVGRRRLILEAVELVPLLTAMTVLFAFVIYLAFFVMV